MWGFKDISDLEVGDMGVEQGFSGDGPRGSSGGECEGGLMRLY